MSRTKVIGAGDLRLDQRGVARRGRIEALIAGGASYGEILDVVDKLYYAREFEAHDRKLSQLAKSLGKGRDTLRKRLRELGLYPSSP